MTALSPKGLFDRVEEVVGNVLEQAVQTDEFADIARAVINLEAVLRMRAERTSRRLWHALNLPAGSDVRRLEEQLSRLERTVERDRDGDAHRVQLEGPTDA